MIFDKQWPTAKFLELMSAQGCRVHFGQFGEDCGLPDLFGRMTGGFYVDVGCHHPTRYSNTLLLWKMLGWRGINIDADIRAVESFRAARPGDINLNFGAGEQSGEMTLSVFDDGAVNTFHPGIAAHQAKSFGQPRMVTVQVRTLASILGEHVPAGVPVDYMNIDCEGTDDAVLRSNDWTRFRPKILTVELHGLAVARAGEHQTVRFMQAAGYELAAFYRVTGMFRRL